MMLLGCSTAPPVIKTETFYITPPDQLMIDCVGFSGLIITVSDLIEAYIYEKAARVNCGFQIEAIRNYTNKVKG